MIIVTGRGKDTAALAIRQILSPHFKIGEAVLIYPTDSPDAPDFEFMVKKAKLSVLVATHVGEYHPEREFFDGEPADIAQTVKLAVVLTGKDYLLSNFDDETVRDIKNKSRAHSLTFGFGVRADIRASDIVLTALPTLGTNFKVNYEGNIVPIWLEHLFGKENIYAALAATAVGEVFNLNLVEISAALKFYQGVSGRMKLIEGIKNTWVLDDAEAASPLNLAESLDVLREIEFSGRKIAVLGDMVGVGKYTVEAHEAIGERVKNSADWLVTIGARAKFYAEGAKIKGLPPDKIFSFEQTKEGGAYLQNEMKEGDLILVDGSSEMKMQEIVNEIKKV